MVLTDNQVKELAELLECGQKCFVRKSTKTIDYHPDINDPMFDADPWQDIIDKIDSNWDDYLEIDKMDSSQMFQVMTDFADSLPTNNQTDMLIQALSGPKPFRTFKHQVDQSNYRQDWFKFRLDAMIEWVKKQL